MNLSLPTCSLSLSCVCKFYFAMNLLLVYRLMCAVISRSRNPRKTEFLRDLLYVFGLFVVVFSAYFAPIRCFLLLRFVSPSGPCQCSFVHIRTMHKRGLHDFFCAYALDVQQKILICVRASKTITASHFGLFLFVESCLFWNTFFLVDMNLEYEY